MCKIISQKSHTSFCSDLHSLEQCPKNWYCRGGLLPPARCPDGKWSAAGSAYLADCGNSFEANVAVLITIIIVFAGLSLCVWPSLGLLSLYSEHPNLVISPWV